ncbi:MAG: hypothetical protein ACJ8DZ_08120 [Allosphingosinicella sp.]
MRRAISGHVWLRVPQRKAGGGRARALAPVVVLAAAAAAGTASAKDRSADAREVMTRFVACSVKRQPELARRYVLHPEQPLSPGDLQKLAPSDCLMRTNPFVAQLRMRGLLYRGAVADALIRREMTGPAPATLAAVPPLLWPAPEPPTGRDERGRPLNERDRKARAVGYELAVLDRYTAQLGECVVRADPSGAKAAIMPAMDTPDELAAMKAISPEIAACVPEGRTVKLNRTTMRAAIALSYYRLAAAAAAGGTGA